jgi:hypothetical protein
MIDFFVNMSIMLGLIIQQAAYIFIFCVFGLFIYYIIKSLPESSCTGDCNQGRNCNCKE